MKQCSKCKVYKIIEEFAKNKSKKDGLSTECKICKRETDKLYRINNPTKSKDYYDKNKERINQRCKLYKKENKDSILIYKREYTKNKRTNDFLYKLDCQIRSLIHNSFNRKSFIKCNKTIKIVDCTLLQLKEYLKTTAINNYGFYDENKKYHIDHIIPVYTAKTEEDLVKLNHYTNLQYLYPQDNLKKSNSLDFKLNI